MLQKTHRINPPTSKNIGKVPGAFNILFFRVLKKSLTRREPKDVFEMSLRSESHVGNVVVSASGRPKEAQNAPKTASEISGYAGP